MGWLHHLSPAKQVDPRRLKAVAQRVEDDDVMVPWPGWKKWWCVQGFIPGFGNMEVLKDLFDRKGDVWWIPSRPSHFWMMRGKEQETLNISHQLHSNIFWLVVWNMNFICHFIYGLYNPSHWRTPSFFKMGTLHHQPVDSPFNQSDENHPTSGHQDGEKPEIPRTYLMLTPDETKPWFMKIRVGYSSNSQTSSDTFENGTLPISHRRKRGLLIQGWRYGKHDQMISVWCVVSRVSKLWPYGIFSPHKRPSPPRERWWKHVGDVKNQPCRVNIFFRTPPDMTGFVATIHWSWSHL